jgi:hypothetical protein
VGDDALPEVGRSEHFRQYGFVGATLHTFDSPQDAMMKGPMFPGVEDVHS